MEHCFDLLTSGITPEGVLQQLINGIALGSIYALIALGYSMVYGVLELINFAHGDVFMIGTFIIFGVVQATHAGPEMTFPLLLAVLLLGTVLAMVACAALGFAIEKIAYRPLRNAPRLAPLISAIGVSFVLEAWVTTYVSDRNHALPTLIRGEWPIYGYVSVTNVQVLMVISSILMMVGLQFLVRRTRLGRGMRAVAQNREAAALMGVNLDSVISFTFVIGSALAGAAGLLWVLNYSTSNSIGFLLGLKAFTAAVIGGIGNIPGAMLGGFFLGLAEALGAAYISNISCGFFSSSYQSVFAFALLILILVFRPSGILRERVSERA
ncbi:MAG: branched-chain amino acid transport system permease protein [Chloroflexota bacterium]|jgi:branched-chain amino acid transport system permease protein|nr:branched-chain amino acid transport system permease protein [Chloroflexota bacterium]